MGRVVEPDPRGDRLDLFTGLEKQPFRRLDTELDLGSSIRRDSSSDLQFCRLIPFKAPRMLGNASPSARISMTTYENH